MPLGVLKEMAWQADEDCGGLAYSPAEFECLEYCGLKPNGIRPPGAVVKGHAEG